MHLNTNSGSNINIIKSSHGEIAENQWVDIDYVLNMDLCHYVCDSFIEFRNKND